MTTPERVWMTRQAISGFTRNLPPCVPDRGTEVPDDFMDYGDDVAKNAARQARIGRIETCCGNADRR